MKISKKILEQLVENLNSLVGDKYKLDYQRCYGGYSLYNKDLIRDYIHIDDRISATEMYRYLLGLLNGIRAIKNITNFK